MFISTACLHVHRVDINIIRSNRITAKLFVFPFKIKGIVKFSLPQSYLNKLQSTILIKSVVIFCVLTKLA